MKKISILVIGIILGSSGLLYAFNPSQEPASQPTEQSQPVQQPVTTTPTEQPTTPQEPQPQSTNQTLKPIVNMNNQVKTSAKSTAAEPTPSIATQEPVAEPVAPSKILITAYAVINNDDETADCRITYSDNTMYTWRWKTTTYNQDVKTVNQVGFCDGSIIGNEKANTATGYTTPQ